MASTYLTRTSTSTGNRKIGTLSMWVKRGKEVEEVPFGWGSDNQDFTSLIFNGSNQIELRHKVSNTYKGQEIIHLLTHLTDQSQNDKFHDNYFSGIDIDVSKALFIT